jgi:hypothetical protein
MRAHPFLMFLLMYSGGSILFYFFVDRVFDAADEEDLKEVWTKAGVFPERYFRLAIEISKWVVALSWPYTVPFKVVHRSRLRYRLARKTFSRWWRS